MSKLFKKLQQRSAEYSLLIIEDNAIFQDYYKDNIKNSFKNIYTALKAEDAYNIFKKENPEIVICDIDLPDYSGIDLVEKINKLDHNSEFIIISGFTETNYLIELLDLGVEYFLDKPFEKDLFYSILISAINSYERNLILHSNEKIHKKSITDKDTFTKTFRVNSYSEIVNLSNVLSKACPDPDNASNGIYELLINSLEHGNLGITYDDKTSLIDNDTWEEELLKRSQLPENKNKKVKISFSKTKDYIKFIIYDEGAGFDFEQYFKLDNNRIYDNHGRGIYMVKNIFFDELYYPGNGNEVVAMINL